MNKKFVDLLMSERELTHDLIIGNVEMPVTLVWDKDSQITDYTKAEFQSLMEAECKVEDDFIEVFSDDYKLGEKFTLAASGLISASEFDKMFICH